VTRSLLVAACLLLGLGGEASSVLPEERTRILQRFDHRVHREALRRADLSCAACHQVGGTAGGKVTPETQDQALLAPPPGACHTCHVASGTGHASGPGTCATCHTSDVRPQDHQGTWASEHAAEARLQGRVCFQCHARSECVDCHERKDTTRYRVHDRSWLSVHGIAVQADPAACSTCHLKSECVSCHATGQGRRP
jgi:hypothetical protein